jgi:hypothetical protein
MSIMSIENTSGLSEKVTRTRRGVLGLFTALPLQRKILFFLAGGVVTLVFDAFIAHFSWNHLTMRWTQMIPIAFGLLAALTLGTTVMFALPARLHRRIVTGTGLFGMAVGLTGMTLHGLAIAEALKGEEVKVTAIGKALSLAPPLFAPAAFAGVGFLLIALHWIAPLPDSEG